VEEVARKRQAQAEKSRRAEAEREEREARIKDALRRKREGGHRGRDLTKRRRRRHRRRRRRADTDTDTGSDTDSDARDAAAAAEAVAGGGDDFDVPPPRRGADSDSDAGKDPQSGRRRSGSRSRRGRRKRRSRSRVADEYNLLEAAGYVPNADVEVLEDRAVGLFMPWKVALKALFKRYVGLSASAAGGAGGRDMSFDQVRHARVNLTRTAWLRLCRDFKIVSGMVTSTDSTAVFHRCNLRRDKGAVRALLGYSEFLAALRVIALHKFRPQEPADTNGSAAGASGDKQPADSGVTTDVEQVSAPTAATKETTAATRFCQCVVLCGSRFVCA